jgi:hypothetical protein
MMQRLLSPNEAKFWLLDRMAPMNCAIVVHVAERQAARSAPGRFTVPVVHLDGQSRPRWGEADREGVIEHQDVDSEHAWLAAAQSLMDMRVGSVGHPPWCALLQHHSTGTTLILAVNHALTDWRTSLHVAQAFLNGEDPGPLAPPCEELLPASCYGSPDAEDLLDAWWSERAAARWQALGFDGLTRILPPAAPTRFTVLPFTDDETGRLLARCEAEGASLNAALAVALRDAMGIEAVAHSVGMERFIRPPSPPGPGVAVSHVFTPLRPGPFWEAARDNRADLFAQVRDGVAGDMLLSLPRLLMGAAPAYQLAVMTITGAPTVNHAPDDPGMPMQLVMSSARGGGGILIRSTVRNRLQLIAGSPANVPEMPFGRLADCLMAACA